MKNIKRNQTTGRFVKEPVMDRFLQKIKINKNGCWEWTAHKDKDGYGSFSIDRKFIRANRASWILFVGEIPSNLWVLHKCDNPKCVNPNHLFLGNAQDNATDRDLKCRNSRGKKVNTNILDEKDVLFIRKNKGDRRKLANKFGVSISTITDIINFRSWKWLKQ